MLSGDLCIGLIVSGGQDTIIEAREPLAGAQGTDESPAYMLLGHSHNICSLDAYGDIVVSGSWDGYLSLPFDRLTQPGVLTGGVAMLVFGKTAKRNIF